MNSATDLAVNDAIRQGWQRATLGSLSTRITRRVQDADVPIMMIASTKGFILQQEKYGRYMAGESAKRYTELKSGEFAYNKGNSKSYPQGCIYRLTAPRAAVPHVYFCFTLDAAQIDGDFASQLFLSGALNQQLATRINAGVRNNGLLNINADAFFSVSLDLPPLHEQRKIAAILSAVDGVIVKTEAVIDSLEALNKAMTQELLTRGLPGRHKRYKQTEIGEIPEDWTVLRVGETATAQQGLQIPIAERHKIPGDDRLPYLTIKYLSRREQGEPAEYIESARRSVICTEDDVLLARTGATGKVVTGVAGVFHNNFFRIDFDRTRLTRAFLCCWLRSERIQHEIQLRAGTTTIPDLNHRDFLSILIGLPPLNEQASIAENIDGVDYRLRVETVAAKALRQCRQTLVTALLSGQLRVTGGE